MTTTISSAHLVQFLQLTSQLVLVGQIESGKVDRLVEQPFKKL